VAVRFAITQRGEPQNLDSVVFSSSLATDLGLTPQLTLRLAATILADDGQQVERIRDREVMTLAAALYRLHPELRDHLKGSWPGFLEGYLSDPPSQD
jgi:hypothetical protein